MYKEFVIWCACLILECLIPNICWLKDQISSSFIWVSVMKNGTISFRTSNQMDPCLNLPSRETWFNRGSEASSRDSKNVSLYLQNRVDVHACGVNAWSNRNPYRLTTVCCHDENFCAWVKHKFCPTNVNFRSDAAFFVFVPITEQGYGKKFVSRSFKRNTNHHCN